MEGRMDGFYEELFAADDRMDGTMMMVIFVVFNMFKRVADQAKNICDQTVFAARGIAKLPKVYRILLLDQPGSGIAQLAASIGRNIYPDTAEFTPVTPGVQDPLSGELGEFLNETGLPDENLESEQLEGLEHDISSFVVVVSLNGQVSDYIDKVPFHTSALNWEVPEGADRAGQYRYLRDQIISLITLLAGNPSEQA